MELLRTVLLVVHVLAGFAALSTGIVALIARKGRKVHNRAGMVFYYGMITVMVTAYVLAATHFNAFLLVVALLSGYAAVTGVRVLRFMRRKASPGAFDKAFWWGHVLSLAAFDGYLAWRGVNFFGGFGIVLTVFSLILAQALFADLRLYRKHKKVGIKANTWLLEHISRMMGAFTAAVTAFLVNNITNVEPVFIVWLAPTLLLTPLTIYYKRKYRRKNKKASPKAGQEPQTVLQQPVSASVSA